MPLLIQVTEGLLTPHGEREVLPRVAEALVDAHGLTGNRFLTPNVVGHLDILPLERCYVGGKHQSLAVVEVKVPPITFASQAVRDAFVRTVTDIIERFSAGDHPRERTFVNVTYAVEGTWGIAGRAYSNEALAAALQAG